MRLRYCGYSNSLGWRKTFPLLLLGGLYIPSLLGHWTGSTVLSTACAFPEFHLQWECGPERWAVSQEEC